jgi:hypothetical protein
MVNTSNIRQRMEVLGLSGGYVGIVDAVQGNTIRLAHEDPDSGGEYHFIPLDWVQSVDEAVHLNKPYDDAMREWQTGPLVAGT